MMFKLVNKGCVCIVILLLWQGLVIAADKCVAYFAEDFDSMANGSLVVGQNGWQKMNYWGSYMNDLYVNFGTPGPGGTKAAGGPWDWAIGAAGKAIGPDAGSGNVYTLEAMVNPGADGDPIHLFLGNSAIVDNVAYPDTASINNAKARAQLSYSDTGSPGSLWFTTAVNGGATWEQHYNDYHWPPQSPRIPHNWVQFKMVVDYSAGTTSSYWRDVDDATGLPIGNYIQMASIADVPSAVTHVGAMMYGYTDGWAPFVDNITLAVTGDYGCDLNCDGFVNFKDLAILADHWLANNTQYDITGDSYVNLKDLGVLASCWFDQTPVTQTPVTQYISDMSECLPASAFSTEQTKGKWQLFDYKTGLVNGTLIGVRSFIDAQDLTIPLNVYGWYAIYIGYWNAEFHYDGDGLIKIRLSDDPAFRQIAGKPTADGQDRTFFHEVFVDNADLTGQDIVIGKSSGLAGRKCYVAYIKLVPLEPTKVQEIQQDRADPNTRRLTAVMDGFKYFANSEYDTAEQIRELVELYRYSDVGKVLWGINRSCETNYRSLITGTSWVGRQHNNMAVIDDNHLNAGILGEKQCYESLRAFDANGTMPQDIIASHAHSMGLKFDLMFPMGLSGGIKPFPGWDPNSIVNLHPEACQKTRAGTTVQKASYAVPAMRQFMINLIQEAVTKFDADGVNLCFTRGPHYIQYEQNFINSFYARYYLDPRNLPADDPRIYTVRASIMTQLVSGIRSMLNTVGSQKGRQLTLSVWVWPSNQALSPGGTPFQEGIDVANWLQNGLVDTIICEGPVDPNYLNWCQSYQRNYIYFKSGMGPADAAQAYGLGVARFAYRDIDSTQMDPESWAWIRRIGHQNEMANWDPNTFKAKPIQVLEVNGINVANPDGLPAAVYSGG